MSVFEDKENDSEGTPVLYVQYRLCYFFMYTVLLMLMEAYSTVCRILYSVNSLFFVNKTL